MVIRRNAALLETGLIDDGNGGKRTSLSLVLSLVIYTKYMDHDKVRERKEVHGEKEINVKVRVAADQSL